MISVSNEDFRYFARIISKASRYDFSGYSEKSFIRRLQKILVDYKTDLHQLIKRIKSDEEFLQQIVNEITVNTTELFRDPSIWHTLRYKILPHFQNKKNINIWHAGCSTGQEVYSMLILLNELGLLDKSKMLATDINTQALNIAKKGIYKYRFNIGYLDNFDKVVKENPFNYDEFYDVPYSRYFKIDKVKDTIHMNPFLIEKPFYRVHDLAVDGNILINKFDLVFCRNVIIYFNYELQNRVFDLFYNSIYDQGILFLGKHETILGPFASKFQKRLDYYVKV